MQNCLRSVLILYTDMFFWSTALNIACSTAGVSSIFPQYLSYFSSLTLLLFTFIDGLLRRAPLLQILY